MRELKLNRNFSVLHGFVHAATQSGIDWKKAVFIAIIVVLSFSFLAGSNFLFVRGGGKAGQSATLMNIQAFEETYGLHVNLLALTAAGGMIDLRLRIVDGEKAKLLLQDKANFPVLVVDSSGNRLSVSEDVRSQKIQFEDGGGIFLIYPNSGNAVQPGSSLHIVFGDVRLESIPVR